MSKADALAALTTKPTNVTMYPDLNTEVWRLLDHQMPGDKNNPIGGLTIHFRDGRIVKTSPIYVTNQDIIRERDQP